MSHNGWDISHPTYVHYIVMSVIRSNTLFGHLYVSVKQEMNNFSNGQRTSQNVGQNHHQDGPRPLLRLNNSGYIFIVTS